MLGSWSSRLVSSCLGGIPQPQDLLEALQVHQAARSAWARCLLRWCRAHAGCCTSLPSRDSLWRSAWMSCQSSVLESLALFQQWLLWAFQMLCCNVSCLAFFPCLVDDLNYLVSIFEVEWLKIFLAVFYSCLQAKINIVKINQDFLSLHEALGNQARTTVKMPCNRSVAVYVKPLKEVLDWCNNLLDSFKSFILVKLLWNNKKRLLASRFPVIVKHCVWRDLPACECHVDHSNVLMRSIELLVVLEWKLLHIVDCLKSRICLLVYPAVLEIGYLGC